MDLPVALFTPGACLGVQVVQVSKAYARPKAGLNNADRALNLAFRLWGVSPTDPWRDPNCSHKIGKQVIPDRRAAIHLQQYRLHPVGEHGAWQPTEILARE